MTKVSVDLKGQLWWIAAFIWGWVTTLSVLSVHNQIDLFSFGLFAVLLIFGGLLSIPAAQKYMKGGFASSAPEPMSVQFSDTQEDKGEYSFRIVGQQKTKIGPRVKQPQITQTGFIAWWVFVRAPLLIGDWILSALWGALGNLDRENLPGVGSLPGFGSGAEKSLLDQAREKGLVDPDDEVGTENPYVSNF